MRTLLSKVGRSTPYKAVHYSTATNQRPPTCTRTRHRDPHDVRRSTPPPLHLQIPLRTPPGYGGARRTAETQKAQLLLSENEKQQLASNIIHLNARSKRNHSSLQHFGDPADTFLDSASIRARCPHHKREYDLHLSGCCSSPLQVRVLQTLS